MVVYFLAVTIYAVAYRETAQNTGRKEKAVSPIYFNTQYWGKVAHSWYGIASYGDQTNAVVINTSLRIYGSHVYLVARADKDKRTFMELQNLGFGSYGQFTKARAIHPLSLDVAQKIRAPTSNININEFRDKPAR